MSIVPVVAFAGAVLLAVVFEAVYTYIDARVILSMEHGEYTMFYWLIVVTLGFTTGIIPHRPPDFPKDWVAFFLLVMIHVALNIMNPGVLSWRQRSSGPSSGCSSGNQNSGNNPPNDDPNSITNCDENE
jgi:hypothetical protein